MLKVEVGSLEITVDSGTHGGYLDFQVKQGIAPEGRVVRSSAKPTEVKAALKALLAYIG